MILAKQPIEGLFGILLILIGIPYYLHRSRRSHRSKLP
jgi:hypothetical protein